MLLYHDDVGVDVVGARLIWVPVIQHHPSVVDWRDKQAVSTSYHVP